MKTKDWSIEGILQDCFGCKKPFKKDGSLSVNGVAAYGKLTDLLYRLSDNGILTQCTVNKAISTIDEICESN